MQTELCPLPEKGLVMSTIGYVNTIIFFFFFLGGGRKIE